VTARPRLILALVSAIIFDVFYVIIIDLKSLNVIVKIFKSEKSVKIFVDGLDAVETTVWQQQTT
jgi:hypothetical protein